MSSFPFFLDYFFSVWAAKGECVMIILSIFSFAVDAEFVVGVGTSCVFMVISAVGANLLIRAVDSEMLVHGVAFVADRNINMFLSVYLM